MASEQDTETTEAYENRAPGWVIRCLNCGFTEPYGKYGIRKAAAGRPRTLGWCSRCRGIHCHVIEKRKRETTPPAVGDGAGAV